MKIEAFELERIQSLWEHTVDINLSESGVHPLSPAGLAELAGGDNKVIDRLVNCELGYSQTNGSIPLRERVAALYTGATPDHVLISNGTSEANFVTIWSLIDEGDELVLMSPNYMQIRGIARGFRGRVVPFHLREENAWAPDLDELRRLVGNKTRAIAVCNPNNPTGAVLTEDEMRGIVEIAAKAGAWLIADEVYLGAERDSARTTSFWSFHESYDRMVINNGLSKAYGLPGLRIGWTVSTPEMAARLWSYRDYTTIAPGALSDQIAQIALEPETREKIFLRTRGILQGNYTSLYTWIQENRDLLDFVEPKAGAIAFIHCKIKMDSIDFVEKLRREKSVLIVPGEHFGLNGYIRLGFGSTADLLQNGLARISEMFRELREE